MKTQNALKEHKKLYKSGRSWVIGTVFTSVLGGALFLNTVNVNADSTVQSAAAISTTQPAQTQQTPTFAATATLSKSYAEQMSDWNQSEAAYSAAQTSADAEVASESAANQSAATSYQNQLDSQVDQQKASNSAAYSAAQQNTAASNAALKASQTAAYNAASTAAANSLAAMPQQSASAGEAGNGGTLSYVEQTGDFSNVITHTDANTVTWNGNYLIPSLPVANDNQLYDQSNDTSMRLIKDDGSVKNSVIPTYAASDIIVGNKLTTAQQTEMNTYLLKLLNQYREKLGITDLNSTAAMLAAAIERGTTLTTGQMEHNLIYINQAATDNNVGSLAECLGGLNTAMQGNNKTLSMLELMNSAASSLNDMLNSDGGSDWGHRNIFLSDGSTSGFVSGNGAFSLEYNTTLGSWIMNFNADTGSTGTSVVNDTPAATSLPSAGNNSAYEAAKAQSDKTLSNLAATQTTAYNKAVSDSQTALASLKSSQDDVVTNLVFSNSSKLMSYVNGLTSKLNTLKTTLQAQVDALNPGAKPVDTGNDNSSASSSAGSSAGSDGSSAASSAGSSASNAGSDNSSAASSAGSSASSAGSDNSSAASSAGSSSSSTGSDNSSAASSAGSDNSNAASSAGNDSSASSSAASSANSAGSTATQTSSTASSATSTSNSAQNSSTNNAVAAVVNSNDNKGTLVPTNTADNDNVGNVNGKQLTREEYKSNKNNAKLPQTNETANNEMALGLLGAFASMFGIGFIGVRRQH
ncbi:hypothetical protein LOOC260_116720 [Paucilactobacillus hokkaidonensis JCM 18461]|uniref:Gram-positive cocci surface proteins LPxTG domain-containing protein n=2 Tax=Paucilactobacillus hokkaidonensis TaxID=1193095 RepID=A0A0A1GYU5_9LACO|nr:SEC10/PgrA surface exclusion domain-containing protein [Paucilactobacillus hokkaidonensis]KRO08210.1 hypothetical protein IV59_GL001445 [Paucilactobacillus hokkaidonensis]BAP86179.1 hypothetical protein LOOC260_116720 [Paucilactobacillus hokkaidonensis JCM 18461]